MIYISKWRYNYLLLFANIALRLLFIVFPFWGLEYEDSFVFNDSARFLENTNNFFNNSFITNCCIDGSYSHCERCGSFGGHFITFPLIVSQLSKIVGYHYWNIFSINLVFSIAILVIVFFWAKRKNEKHFSLTLFLILMLVTPFISVFSTSGLSETFSSLIVTAIVILFYISSEKDFQISHVSFWLLLTLFSLAVLIKRENLVLFVLFAIIPLFRYKQKEKKIFPAGYLVLLFVTLACYVFLLHYINIIGIETNENIDIGKNTFSLNYLLKNLCQFWLAIINFKFWGLSGFLLLFSICCTFIKKNTYGHFNLYCLAISLGFLTIYSSHYRSFYQVHYNYSNPFETLRYAVNYFPLLCLFMSTNRFNGILKYKKTLFAAMLLLISNAIYARINLSEIEYNSRIMPVKNTLAVAKVNDIIITDIPIVFHCFTLPDQNIISYYHYSNQKLKQRISNYPYSDVFILRSKNFQIDSIRYNSDIDIRKYHFKEINLQLNNYRLYKLDK